MKRLLIVVCVVGFIAALPLSHSAMAGPGNGQVKKVKICHILKNESTRPNFFTGRVMEVSASALNGHCAHGDHNGPNKAVGEPCRRRRVGSPIKLCGENDPVPPPWAL